MAGETITGSLADSLDEILDNAYAVREFPGQAAKVAERHRLEANEGLDWREVAVSQMDAQGVTEQTILDNPQQFADILKTITPTMTGITTIVTDRTYRRVNKKTIAAMGKVEMAAILRKQNADGLTTLDGATIEFGATATPVEFSDFSHAVDRVKIGDANEPANSPIYGILHTYHVTDVKDQITQGIGTYAVPKGLTEDVFKAGFAGTMGGANIFEDGNIEIDSNTDAKSFILARFGFLLIEGADLMQKTKDRPEVGGGAVQKFLYSEYAFGERLAAGTTGGFIAEILGNATAPA